MRILLVADVVGGVRTFTYELARELVRSKVEVDLALIGDDPGPLAELEVSSCQVRDLRLEWMPDPWHDVQATSEWVQDVCRRRPPDLVHMNTFAAVLDPCVPVLLTVHSCVLTWWRAVHGCDAPPSWASYRRLVEVALTRADQVVTPTRALLRDLEAVYGPLPEAQVIADGRGMRGVYDPCANREALMVTAGRLWDEAKNAAQVARAAPAIDGRVVMIGAGAAAPSTSASVESVGELAEAQVVQWLSRAAVFAEPARYEPFGLAALEAALCGCALVLGDIPSLREVWGDAAAYVSPDDARALASAINSLLGHPRRRADAARRAQARAGRYAPAVMAERYTELYAQLTRTAVAA
jgi:glycosyltransferase involved in cell wall biosynthesis